MKCKTHHDAGSCVCVCVCVCAYVCAKSVDAFQVQYEYIHRELAEYLQCGDTSFALANARTVVNSLSAIDKGKTGFQKQFEVSSKWHKLVKDDARN